MTKYIVWIHPKKGSDRYRTFDNEIEARIFSRSSENNEEPLRVREGKEHKLSTSKNREKSVIEQFNNALKRVNF